MRCPRKTWCQERNYQKEQHLLWKYRWPARFGHLIQDSTVFVQDGQRYRKTKAVLLPSLQNLERRALPEDSGNNNVSIEDCLDRHVARRLTLAIADFKSAFFTPAFLASARARLKSSWNSSSLGGVMTLRITASPWPMTTNWSPSLSPRSLRTSSGMTTCPLDDSFVVA